MMLRKLLLGPQVQPRQVLARYNSSKLESGQEISLNEYHEASNNKLEELSDRLESILEDRFDSGADVRLSDGVLTAVVDEENTYVINKQTPNKQIWLSSPISGPRRFDLVGGKWVDKGEKIELSSLLSKELSSLLKSQQDI